MPSRPTKLTWLIAEVISNLKSKLDKDIKAGKNPEETVDKILGSITQLGIYLPKPLKDSIRKETNAPPLQFLLLEEGWKPHLEEKLMNYGNLTVVCF